MKDETSEIKKKDKIPKWKTILLIAFILLLLGIFVFSVLNSNFGSPIMDVPNGSLG